MDDVFALYKTQAILRHIDRQAPSPALAPADGHAAARMDQILAIPDPGCRGLLYDVSWRGRIAMNHDEFIASQRQEIVSVSRSILEGRINIIAGIRKLCALRALMDNPEDEVFLPIRAIDSETDHFPIGNQRANWAPESLKKLDQETEEYLDDARDDIFESCREVIRVYSDESTAR